MKPNLGMPMLTFIKYLCNRCRMAAVLILLCLSGFSSNAQQNCKGCGSFYRIDRMFKPELNTYIVPRYMEDVKRLFYDSMMIMPRHRTVINYDTKGQQVQRVDVIGYTLVDYRKKTFTNYGSFSDTARRLYLGDEGYGNLGDAASRFLNTKGKTYEHSIPLTDTVLDGIKCSRIKGFFIEKGDTILSEILYYVSETERPIAYMGKVNIGNKKYSFIRMDHYDYGSGIRGYSAITNLSHNLTREEIKVFEAWRRNAAKFEVKKKTKKQKRK